MTATGVALLFLFWVFAPDSFTYDWRDRVMPWVGLAGVILLGLGLTVWCWRVFP
jgi:hypothetical protein